MEAMSIAVSVSSAPFVTYARPPSGVTTMWAGSPPVGTARWSSYVVASIIAASESCPLTAQTVRPSGATWMLWAPSTPVRVAAHDTLHEEQVEAAHSILHEAFPGTPHLVGATFRPASGAAQLAAAIVGIALLGLAAMGLLHRRRCDLREALETTREAQGSR